MTPALWHCRWRAQKMHNGLCQHFSLGEGCPPPHALMPDTSVPPSIPLVPFTLLPWCWSSEGVSLGKSVCGSFKRNLLGLQKFLSSTALIPIGFYSQKLCRLMFLALESWLGRAWCEAGTPPLLRYVSQFSSITCVCGTILHSAHSVSLPLLPVSM